MSRISANFASKVGLRTPASARRLDDIRKALESSTPSGAASAPTPSGGVCVIAHSAEAQQLFDRLSISWAVQYEIARGVSLGWWKWDEVTPDKVKLLQDPTNTAAARVSQVIRGASNFVSPMDMAIWTELDREEAAIREGRLRGLGLFGGEWMEKANWYGGQIQQVARLEHTDGAFRLVLAKMEMRKSHRFARFLGSRRLLQISVPVTLMYERGDALRDFFRQRFVLCGRVFVVLGAKDNKAFLMEIPEEYERCCRVPGDEQRIPLEDFIDWHNPLHLPDNANQPVKKYVTRFDLGFSISVPALQFQDIYHGEDKCNGNKAPAERIYTDGCGYMNGAALCAIARQMGLEERPTAVQGRIAGAKGLWVLHPRDQSPTGTPKIWIRKSQVKIQLDLNNLHPAHRIFDLLAPPRVSVPSRLSRLTILNLSHNGVPVNVFVELMRDTLDAEVKALTDWSGPKAMLLLWRAVEKAGGVAMKRIMQHAQGTTRATGLTGRIREDDSEQSDDLVDPKLTDALQDLDESETPSVSSLRDPSTGEPLTIHATVMDLLQSGFHPMRLQVLYDKLKKIVTDVIEGIIRDFHVSVPLSAEAFIVPDPHGVLKEDEIQFKSTKDLKDPVEHSQPHIILGEVLIYRNPCRLPSDVRKVTAVQYPELAEYTNVIVLPTVGPYSYASYLAGGDYDGDTCVCIYDPRIVEPFKNSEIFTAPENFLKDNFEDQGKIQQVSALTSEMAQAADPDMRRQKLQEALLCGLITAPIGQYSSFHENAIYMNGYDHPETVRIAFMFNTVLDSRKTGHVVKEEVRKRDKRKYDLEQPPCLKSTKSTSGQMQGNLLPLRRSAGLGRFVLDELLQAGHEMRKEKLKKYDELTTFGYNEKDPDLVAPYNRVLSLMHHETFKDDLALIGEHIEKHIERWQTLSGESSRAPKTPSRRGKAPATVGNSGKSLRALWDELAPSFAAGPEISKDSPLAAIGDLELLKASWAYAQKPKFAWRVAFQALCRIKASTRNPVAVTGEFADMMSITSSAGRVLEQSRLAQA
ncbi:RNA dependent RNA polymerase-domain-containing protein [Cerioporus squamosus]|nr:RNA dependent RNA polymerase-domain-containing protein [Cerioporus squamosus]